MRRKRIQPYLPFVPDILLRGDERLDLAPFGVAGVVTHTPGHTAGSLSVELENKTALVGDLIASGVLLGGLMRTGHAKRPPFEDSPAGTAAALQRLLDAGMEDFHMGHGGPLPAAEVSRHAHMLRALP